eukprot:TRINITY_DN3798_c0_g2_i1.p1 TRINITY_DN3798_c0_g2~~TRINITY_DN3798_c0_g2_i1.p1  ORF type:complete len:268 (-),score=63.39 TRINITY_DN3798_c0_g2_i1:209-1012(-)
MGCAESKESDVQVEELKAKVEALERSMGAQNMASIEQINRLSDRLERVAALLEQQNGAHTAIGLHSVRPVIAPSMQPAQMSNAAPTPLKATAPVSHSAAPSSSIAAYDALLQQYLSPFIQASSNLGGEVREMAFLVQGVLMKLRIVLLNLQNPSAPRDVATALQPITQEYQAASAYKDTHNKAADILHLSAMTEGLAAFSWVGAGSAPVPMMKEAISSSEYYTNRILTQYRGKDDRHVQWVASWSGLLKGSVEFVRTHYTTGLALTR